MVLTVGFIGTFTEAFWPYENIPKVWPCPIDTEFLPCECKFSQATYDIFIDCSDAKTDEELTNAFKGDFPFPDAYNLTIDQSTCTDCNLQSINQETFGPVSFKYVAIENTGIETIEQEAFGNSHATLIDLMLSNNNIQKFPFEALPSYVVLTSLYLDWNQFDETSIIPNIESASLQVLDLSNNPKLSFATASVVANCPNIEEVYFSNGNFYDVPIKVTEPISMFSGLQYIKTVSFQDNHISQLQSNTFVADENTFVSVDLSYNNIADIREDFVSGAVS